MHRKIWIWQLFVNHWLKYNYFECIALLTLSSIARILRHVVAPWTGSIEDNGWQGQINQKGITTPDPTPQSSQTSWSLTGVNSPAFRLHNDNFINIQSEINSHCDAESHQGREKWIQIFHKYVDGKTFSLQIRSEQWAANEAHHIETLIIFLNDYI